MIMGAANDLIVVFLGLEIMSIALYVLAAHERPAQRVGRGGDQVLRPRGVLVGDLRSTGSPSSTGRPGRRTSRRSPTTSPTTSCSHDGLLLAGLALLLVGFGFKVAAVPFHMWTPDVYQGRPVPVTGFMAAIAKAGGFAALLRVFISLVRDA